MGWHTQFKKRYPDMFLTYQQQCRNKQLRIGHPLLYTKSTPWILNFPTKNEILSPSKLEYIEKSLSYLANHQPELDLESIAFPKLGTGQGQLSWDIVGPLMARYLSHLPGSAIYIESGDREYQPGLTSARV